MIKAFILISLCIVLVSTTGTYAQIRVGLRLDQFTPTSVWQSLLCDAQYNCGLRSNDQRKHDVFGDDAIPISVERNGNNFLVSLDTNGRRGLIDEKKRLLVNSSTIIIKMRKQIAPGHFAWLPYEISHEREDRKGAPEDSFSIRAHYILSGTLRSSQCSLDMALNDMNADGKIELLDGGRGSNLQIDRNKDQRFWGKEEFSSTNEIIELCGRNYLVSAVSFSRIVFRPTNLKLAKVGERVVDFSFDLIDSKRISPESMKGRTYILDFWASWCVPCVKNLPHVKELREELKNSVEIFSINVDSSSRKSLAEQIIHQNQISEFSSIRGLGDTDPVWKMFGGANLNRMVIPLYVLIDAEGIVRFIGNGGDKLQDLKQAVYKNKPAQPLR